MRKKTFEILLIEENVDDAAFMIHSLENGMIAARLCVARDGAEALGILFGTNNSPDAIPLHQPKLILLSLHAPHSLSTLRHLRANPHTRCIPVVVLGPAEDKSALSKAYALGTNRYFVRSKNCPKTAEALRTLCRRGLKTSPKNKPEP